MSWSLSGLFNSFKKWVYDKCKSRPVRYFVSAIAGASAAIVIITVCGLIGLTGPGAIVIAGITFIVVTVKQNQELLAHQRLEQLTEDNARLRHENTEQNARLEEQDLRIERLLNRNHDIAQAADTTLRITSILAKNCSQAAAKKQCEELLSQAPTLRVTMDDVVGGPSVTITLPTPGAAPWGVYPNDQKKQGHDLRQEKTSAAKNNADENTALLTYSG